MPIVKQEKTGQASAVGYATLLKVKLEGIVKASVIITNSHAANIIQYKILCSNDPEGADGSWTQKQAEADIDPYGADPSNAKYHEFDPTPLWIDIQIKTKTGTDHGTGNAWLKVLGS